MKSGIHKATLPQSLSAADQVYLFQGTDVKWSVDELKASLDQPCYSTESIDDLVETVAAQVKPGDHVVIMSNGGLVVFIKSSSVS